jgi:gas vesicle protein
MKIRDRNNLFKALLGAGLYMLDPVRDRIAGRIDDMTERAQDTYDEASDRMGRAGRAIRGEDSHILGTLTALLVGVGVGVGVGLLIAPASGEETRNNIAGKVQDVTDRVRGQAQDIGERVRGQAQEVSERVRGKSSGDRTESQTGTYSR